VIAGGPAAPPPLTFPRDHGAHADVPVEWWYWTGHLSDRAGNAYGFQLTFFRVRELYLAHFAWTDATRKAFRYDEKMHLGLPGIASAAEEKLDVSNEDWIAREGAGGVQHLAASGAAGELRLTLTPVKPPVLQGEKGVSRKGPGAREVSRYVSITRLAATGTLARERKSLPLTGTAWFDHEWGSGVLPADAAGWDWFALQLDDGSELMLYRMRRADGSATPFSSGTFVPPLPRAPLPVDWGDVAFTQTRAWRSPRSKTRYPAGWRIAVRSIGLDVSIEPLVADQELETPGSTGVTYWEGACAVKGTRAGRPITGRAYVELTGYAGRDVPGMAEISGRAARLASPWAGSATFRSAALRPSAGSTSSSLCCDRRRGSGP
jgi:predicted secreted hydrolase